jgi:hypothetical protein
VREIERDVLLASSGELGPLKRARLARRLARDPEARRLAETLGVASLLLGPAPAAQRRRSTLGWLAATSVATAALGLGLVLRVAFRERPPESNGFVQISAPLSETTGWLLVDYEAVPLPPWSEELDESDTLDLMTDERIP